MSEIRKDPKVQQYLLKQKSNEKSRKNEECRMREKKKKSFGRKMTEGHAITLIRNYYCDVRE